MLLPVREAPGAELPEPLSFSYPTQNMKCGGLQAVEVVMLWQIPGLLSASQLQSLRFLPQHCPPLSHFTSANGPRQKTLHALAVATGFFSSLLSR